MKYRYQTLSLNNFKEVDLYISSKTDKSDHYVYTRDELSVGGLRFRVERNSGFWHLQKENLLAQRKSLCHGRSICGKYGADIMVRS